MVRSRTLSGIAAVIIAVSTPSTGAAQDQAVPYAADNGIAEQSRDGIGGGLPENLFQIDIDNNIEFTASYQRRVASRLSLGVLASLDTSFGHTGTGFYFDYPAITLGLPLRVSLLNHDRLSIGLRGLIAGVYFPGEAGYSGPSWGGVLAIGGSVTYWAIPKTFLFGGAIDAPFSLNMRSGVVYFMVPLLVGPVAEYHLTEHVGLAADIKVGPHFDPRAAVAAAYSLAIRLFFFF